MHWMDAKKDKFLVKFFYSFMGSEEWNSFLQGLVEMHWMQSR